MKDPAPFCEGCFARGALCRLIETNALSLNGPALCELCAECRSPEHELYEIFRVVAFFREGAKFDNVRTLEEGSGDGLRY
jgi:hypothetical protein